MAELLQPTLQRSGLDRHRSHQGRNAPQLGAAADRHDNRPPLSTRDGGPHEEQISLVRKGKVAVGQCRTQLLNRRGFTGQRGFLRAQARSLEQPGIRWDVVARLHIDDVARH